MRVITCAISRMRRVSVHKLPQLPAGTASYRTAENNTNKSETDMKKPLFALLSLAALQGCTALLPPNTPKAFTEKLSDSAFGNVYTAAPTISYQDSVRNLKANMDACVDGVRENAVIRAQGPWISSSSGIWHYAVTAASDSLTQFTLRREALGLSGPQHEGGNIVAVINVEQQPETGVSITGYSPWGSAWLMEPIMAWGQGKNPGCPIG